MKIRVQDPPEGLQEAEIDPTESKTVSRTSGRSPGSQNLSPRGLQEAESDPQEAEIDPQDLCKALEMAKTVSRTLKTLPQAVQPWTQGCFDRQKDFSPTVDKVVSTEDMAVPPVQMAVPSVDAAVSTVIHGHTTQIFEL